jgi:hypothetical protein
MAMGHHYVPQKYLRGFAETENKDAIWMYDKKLRKFTNPGIKSVAQEAGFYSDEVEQQLNELVEKPANRVLDKLRNQDRISEIERVHLAVYIAIMPKRVPKRRIKAFSILPEVFEKTINEVRAEIQEWGRTTQNKDLFERRLLETEIAEQSFRKKTPESIVEQIRKPWASKQIISLVCAMPWRIVRSTRSDFFLTSDNPAYFFEAYGIGNPKSELTFPISTDLALFASWQGEQNSISYVQARPALIREANRRLISGAERFIFSHRQEDWIAKISDNPKPYLSRIQW